MTGRQFIADIFQDAKISNLDDWVSPKWILSKARSIIADFLKKDVSSNKLLSKIVEGWTEIECLELEEVPVTSCGLDVNLCSKLMKSKVKLPEIYSSKFGPIIKQVMSVDITGTEYYFCDSLRKWKNIQKRQFNRERYYLFLDGYLYIPIPKGDTFSPEKVRFEAYFKDKWEVSKFLRKQETCEECGQNEDYNKCIKPLDYQLVIPYYLENDVKKETIMQIYNSFKVIQDTNPDMDSNQKTGATAKQINKP